MNQGWAGTGTSVPLMRKIEKVTVPVYHSGMRDIFLLIAVIVCSSCRNSPPVMKNSFDPWHAEKAKILSAKLPLLNPENNSMLISTRDFVISTADVFRSFTESEERSAFKRMETMGAKELELHVRGRAMMLAERRLLAAAAHQAEIPDSSGVFVMGGTNLVGHHSGWALTSDKIRRYWNRLKPDIPVTTEEMRRAYGKRIFASVQYLYLKTVVPEEEKAKLRRGFETVLAQARSGKDFETLSRDASWEGNHRLECRLIADIYPGLHEKAFDDVAFGLPVGAISGIINVASGMIILKVLERRGEWRPFDQLHDQLAEAVRGEKFPEFMRVHLDTLKEKAELRVMK